MAIINIRADRTHRITLVFLLLLSFIYALRGSSDNSTSRVEDRISLRDLLAGAIRAAEIGGDQVYRVHEKNNTTGNNTKEKKCKQTSRDLAVTAEFKSHCAMVDFLSSTFPGVVIRAEDEYEGYCQTREDHDFDAALETLEGYDTGYDELVKASDVTVWIDPLDASKAFTENLLGHVTTMACIAVKGVPVIGVINKPFDGKRTYWGWAGHAISKSLRNRYSPKVRTMIVSRTQWKDIVGDSKKFYFGDDVQFIAGPGAGYKSLELAVANATVYAHLATVKKFRVCAGAAILTSVGGMMTTSDGKLLEDFGPNSSMDIEPGIMASLFRHKTFYDETHEKIEDKVCNNKVDKDGKINLCKL